MKFPHLIAHRGAPLCAPENTMASFQKAHELGATWVETDVMLTKDLMPILHHDDSLKRLTGIDKCIQDCTWEDLMQYDIRGEKIPSLDSLLAFLMKHQMGLNLELKPTLHQDIKTAHIALQKIMDCGFPKSHLLISSFSLVALEAAYEYAPHYHYGWLSDNDAAMHLGLASNIPFVSMNIDKARATELLVSTLRNRGYQVLCYTENDRAKAEVLLDMGVAAVFSDDPSLFNI